jgi:hypothetical protein
MVVSTLSNLYEEKYTLALAESLFAKYNDPGVVVVSARFWEND